MISSATSTVALGISQSYQNFNQSADTIADPNQTLDASSLVALKVAQHGLEANVAVAKAVFESTESVLDILI
ncbi:hypothetical protein OAF34_00125 [Pirellulaceae bacterium]|jgi:hypothetical protein|nr:hypothetical protein [Pirellulaceae bacterium]